MLRFLALLLWLFAFTACSTPVAGAPVDESANVQTRPHTFVLRGRIVDGRGRGVPPLPQLVELQTEKSRLTIKPMEEGTFHFRLWEKPNRCQIRARTGNSWDLVGMNEWGFVTIPLESLESGQEIEIPMNEAIPGTIHGHAVRAGFETPLADVQFRLRSGECELSSLHFEPVIVRTDEQGGFHSPEITLGGSVLLEPLRGHPAPLSFLKPGAGLDSSREQSINVQFQSGPRIPISLSGTIPHDPSTLHVRVRQDGSKNSRSAAILHIGEGGLLTAQAIDLGIPAGEEVFIVLRTPGGELGGQNIIEWQQEDWTTPLEIELQPTGQLRIEHTLEGYETEEFHDLERALQLVTYRVESADRSSSNQFMDCVNRKQYQLQPGQYRVTLSSRDHVRQVHEIEIHPGESEVIRGHLQLEPGVRPMEGTFRTQSGASVPNCELVFFLRDQPDRKWNIEYHAGWHCVVTDFFATLEEGSQPEVASFRVPFIPPGDLTLEAKSSQGDCSVDLRENSDGTLEVEVLILDGEGKGH